MIALVPRDPDADRELFRRDQSDLDGTFSLGNVIPGEYTVVAIENGWDLNCGRSRASLHTISHRGKKSRSLQPLRSLSDCGSRWKYSGVSKQTIRSLRTQQDHRIDLQRALCGNPSGE